MQNTIFKNGQHVKVTHQKSAYLHKIGVIVSSNKNYWGSTVYTVKFDDGQTRKFPGYQIVIPPTDVLERLKNNGNSNETNVSCGRISLDEAKILYDTNIHTCRKIATRFWTLYDILHDKLPRTLEDALNSIEGYNVNDMIENICNVFSLPNGEDGKLSTRFFASTPMSALYSAAIARSAWFRMLNLPLESNYKFYLRNLKNNEIGVFENPEGSLVPILSFPSRALAEDFANTFKEIIVAASILVH